MRRRGIAIFPFIFLHEKAAKKDAVLLNHEKIHLRQQLELLILPFYLIYVVNYLYELIQTWNHEQAYRKILFEQEAYNNESDLEYLKKRKKFAYLYYL
ncbi:MAG: hypothetical protein IPI23_12000 [Bacteroidetes bacterium]|nr:hypothetical protein [Bacteroidota bacterium]MBK7389753.1 hypothetical protein [Bacteroidota bacterium]MBK9425427.1 hypothetical protein [Bacteroidota bacterium]